MTRILLTSGTLFNIFVKWTSNECCSMMCCSIQQSKPWTEGTCYEGLCQWCEQVHSEVHCQHWPTGIVCSDLTCILKLWWDRWQGKLQLHPACEHLQFAAAAQRWVQTGSLLSFHSWQPWSWLELFLKSCSGCWIWMRIVSTTTKAKNPQWTRVPDSNTSRATTISEPQSHHQRSSSYHHCLKFLSKYSCLDE